ncbi:hydrogenase small subunit [Paludibaculum fermentans]|uniref:Hydrogenase small subunit n=1 Tax=Paludibaculum fermentans TaxID=1473598 RepID=A0A7S7NSA4_PALFE|nr:hydrogenase small subunit [Paludibaculum fermentans]QOY88910.1 hydrogenase small subunit [Paludibaculum fermentans]
MSLRSAPSTYDLLRTHGVDRRTFLRFCTATAAALGLESALIPQVVSAMETKPRLPVLWLHGLECTCCSESFIRSSHPIAADIVLNMISLDYDDTLMAAAGDQAEENRRRIMKDYKGQYIVAVEGNAPTRDGGVYCTIGGETFLSILKETCADAKAVIAWGSCASNGCVQAAKPNPTGATPVHEIIHDKPVINVPGCPPIAEVMTGVITYILTFDALPELDRFGRPKMFYGQRIHDKCYRRAFFDAGQFVENWDDEGARKGWCLYKMGCRGPMTYNSCSTMKWNNGVSFPIGSGHPCIGCSEENFWDNGPFYQRLGAIPVPGIDSTPDAVGKTLAVLTGAGVAAHLVSRAALGGVMKKITSPPAQPPPGPAKDDTKEGGN